MEVGGCPLESTASVAVSYTAGRVVRRKEVVGPPRGRWTTQGRERRCDADMELPGSSEQMFLLNGEVLFTNDTSRREGFFEVSEKDGIGAGNIHFIAGFILEEYDTMFTRVTWTLVKWKEWEDSREKIKVEKSRSSLKLILRQGKNKVFATIRSTMQCNRVGKAPDRHHVDWTPPSPMIEANLHLWQMYTSRFVQRTTQERETFIHFLTSQGLGMF